MMPVLPWSNPELLGGNYFCVRDDLAAARTLVTPKALHQGPSGVGSNKFLERHGIIILGFAYEYVSALGGTGFNLESFDDTVIEGASTVFTIWKSVAPAATNQVVSLCVNNIAIPLSPAEGLNNATTPANGASLRTTLTGAPVGWVMVWGVHGTLATAFSANSFTGSPIAF